MTRVMETCTRMQSAPGHSGEPRRETSDTGAGGQGNAIRGPTAEHPQEFPGWTENLRSADRKMGRFPEASLFLPYCPCFPEQWTTNGATSQPVLSISPALGGGWGGRADGEGG